MDESGFYSLPGVVKTYGPKGRTPILQEWQTREHLSVMSGVTPEGKLYTLVRSVAEQLAQRSLLGPFAAADQRQAVGDLERLAD